MPFAITGSKYGVSTLLTAAITNVNISIAVFVGADFNQTRLVGLWDSTGATFKGLAWARRFITTTQLELQTAFFDPATGLTVTQVVGDRIQVSKNFLESVVVGLAVSGKNVTITDQVNFGSATADSVCFYDEGKEITSTAQVKSVGGVTVWGKLDSYVNRSTSSACNFFSSMGGGSTALHTDGANANLWVFGGILDGVNSPLYFGGYQGVVGNSLGFWNVQNPFDFISPGAGGGWGAKASRMQIINCFAVTTATNAIMQRWGDGVISGGQYKFPNFTSGPISIFGSDSGGTFAVAAPPNTRAIVLDMGNGPCLVRGGATVYNFTNLITTDRRNMSGASGTLTPNNGASATFRFSDSYSNLQASTVGVILDSSAAVADSILSSGAIWSPSLLRATSVGVTVTINSTSWTFGFKKYGFNAVSGAIAVGAYDLGTAGTPENVSFGGPIVQSADLGVTLSNSAAAALVMIAHYSDLYDASINWGTLSTLNAQYPSLSAYPITPNGTELDLGIKNLTLNPSAVAAFGINTSTNTLTAKAAALSTTAKFSSIKTTGTITASFTVAGAYTYFNGVLNGATGAPSFAGGQANIGAANTYTFTSASSTVSLTPIAASTYVFTGAHTGTMDLRNATAFAITVQVPLGTVTSTVGNTGGVITVTNPAITGTATVSGAVANSRILIRNTTTSAIIFDAIATGYSNVYVEGTDFTTGQTYSVTVTHVDKLEIVYTGTVSASGFTVTVAQLADTVYVAKGFNGSLFTGINFNTGTIDLDLDGSVDPVVLWGETYARYKYQTTLSAGIRTLIGAMFAKDLANFTFSSAVVFNNLSATPVQIGGDGYAARADGLSMFGTGSIRIDNSTGVLIANAADVTAIKAKTDNLPIDPASNAAVNTRLASASYTAPNNAGIAAIPTNPLLTSDIRLNTLDVAISTRLASAAYTAAPSVVAIRSEIDTNSTKLDVATSTRLASAAYTAPNNAGIAAIPTNPLLTTDVRLNTLDVAISTRLATAGYTAPPSVVAIRSEIDTNSTKLTVATSALETTVNANANAAAMPANVWSATSEAGQAYGKQIRDMRATLLGTTTGAGTTSEAFRAADGATVRVTSTNDGTNRTNVAVPGG